MPRNTNLTLTKNESQRTPAFATGKLVFPATAIVASDFVEIELGFTPSHVRFVNLTDRATFEWFAGMADDSCLKTIADGTMTTVTPGITPTARGFRVSQNATLAAITASDTCYYTAEA